MMFKQKLIWLFREIQYPGLIVCWFAMVIVVCAGAMNGAKTSSKPDKSPGRYREAVWGGTNNDIYMLDTIDGSLYVRDKTKWVLVVSPL